MSNVTLRIENGFAHVVVNDGKVNAMSVALMTEIGAALDEAERAKAVVILRGRPGMFSAGFDLKTFRLGLEPTLAMLRAGAGLVSRILAFPQPVLTVCEGHAYPMGAFLMLSADARFGLQGPFSIGLNETAIGLTLPTFAVELARHRLAPPGFARVASGALFPPEEALRLGYLDRVLSPEALEGEVLAEAQRLRDLDQPSFAATKARINAPVLRAIAAAVADELQPPT
jgi:enoyl-CoA hydratase